MCFVFCIAMNVFGNVENRLKKEQVVPIWARCSEDVITAQECSGVPPTVHGDSSLAEGDAMEKTTCQTANASGVVSTMDAPTAQSSTDTLNTDDVDISNKHNVFFKKLSSAENSPTKSFAKVGSTNSFADAKQNNIYSMQTRFGPLNIDKILQMFVVVKIAQFNLTGTAWFRAWVATDFASEIDELNNCKKNIVLGLRRRWR